MKNYQWLLTLFLILYFTFSGTAQSFKNGKLTLNEDGSRWVKLTLLNQVWVRSMDYNPGTTKFGYDYPKGTDIGIRRYRIQFLGQLTDRVFFYSQFGENNFNDISNRKLGFFVHDAVGEYAIDREKLSLGAGLTAWGGLSRFSAPSVGSILGVDAPLFLQSTNDVTDQFLRKLSLYFKGKLGKLDYRLTMADPMAIQRSNSYEPNLSSQSNFSPKPAKKQWNGYFMYQFLDREGNQTPYMTGTYLGKKKVFNIGAGFVFQPEAMWHSGVSNADTLLTNMVQLATDIYYDAPINENGASISFYGNFTHFDFGPNYIRQLGAMNPTTGSTATDILNGGGNAYPAYGTGNTLYFQAGIKSDDNFIGNTSVMPYVSLQHSVYERLNDPVNFIDAGLAWFLSEHSSKLTLGFQNRPVFTSGGDITQRKSGVILQYQVYFN
ncbi:hypothetical protein [Jiulongibacter sediminis]|jgi:hypothetical protein|uniref:hypothetical protein n=1 Tax=Jiulongibacter sediminis TaxID=1605367 RepID=UPI0026EC42D1|nr:hypothetical protein [Jiulongibacter sediminis]